MDMSWSFNAFRKHYSQAFQRCVIDCRHLLFADLAKVFDDPQLVDPFKLLQADHRVCSQTPYILQKNMSRKVQLLQMRCDRCDGDQRAEEVADIVGDDQNRTCPTLLTAFKGIQVCQVDISALVDPVAYGSRLAVELVFICFVSHPDHPPQNFIGSAAFLLAPL